tara:strand:+ start:571 stop:1902 length:1332 start_codon:yes stop_codon:yes gene_type:complete
MPRKTSISQTINPTFKLDPWQKKFLETKGDKHLCTGRQVGKSVVCGIDAGEYAIRHKNKVILMIAPTERQAYALFEKTLDYIYRNARVMIKKGRFRPTKSKIALNNGTIIWCLPTGLTGLGIRFLTVHRLYIDECSRVPEPVFEAITPMLLTTGGDTIMLSTPFGTQGYFYDVLINKKNAFDSFTRFRTDSLTVIQERQICDTWSEFQRDKAIQRLEAEKARMTTLAYAQEYMGQPLNDLKQVFPDNLLKEICVLKRLPRILPNRQYFLGQDIAGMGRDLSTWEIFDGTNKTDVRQVENITRKRTRCPERVDFTTNLEARYRFKKIGIDDGGIGAGDFGYLLVHPQTRRKVIGLNNAQRDINRDGTKKKRLLKEDMYTNLLAMMENKHIKLLDDEDIFHSLRSVQFETTNQRTKYFGNDTHIAEGIIRAAWLVRTKGLNIYLY